MNNWEALSFCTLAWSACFISGSKRSEVPAGRLNITPAAGKRRRWQNKEIKTQFPDPSHKAVFFFFIYIFNLNTGHFYPFTQRKETISPVVWWNEMIGGGGARPVLMYRGNEKRIRNKERENQSSSIWTLGDFNRTVPDFLKIILIIKICQQCIFAFIPCLHGYSQNQDQTQLSLSVSHTQTHVYSVPY